MTNIYDLDPIPPDPEGMNDDRAEWAADAIAAFMATSKTDEADALCDLLADLMHWSDRQRDGESFDTALDRARGHYEAETAEPRPGGLFPRYPEPDYDNPFNEDAIRSGREGR